MKLQTKLRYVDIYSHWLGQEVQRSSIHIRLVPTKEMIADGLTKALSIAQKHDSFVRMTGIADQKDPLAQSREKKTLSSSCELTLSKVRFRDLVLMRPDTYSGVSAKV